MNLDEIATSVFNSIGAATDVSVNGGGRYIAFKLKRPDGSSRVKRPDGSYDSEYLHGVCELQSLSTYGKVHVFDPPLIIARGIDRSESTIDFDDFIRALRKVGVKTNDWIPEDNQ